MQLTLANVGEPNIIKKICGKLEIKTHLENMGLVVGSNISIVTQMDGNLIVNVKDTRVAISREMAQKIII